MAGFDIITCSELKVSDVFQLNDAGNSADITIEEKSIKVHQVIRFVLDIIWVIQLAIAIENRVCTLSSRVLERTKEISEEMRMDRCQMVYWMSQMKRYWKNKKRNLLVKKMKLKKNCKMHLVHFISSASDHFSDNFAEIIAIHG